MIKIFARILRTKVVMVNVKYQKNIYQNMNWVIDKSQIVKISVKERRALHWIRNFK